MYAAKHVSADYLAIRQDTISAFHVIETQFNPCVVVISLSNNVACTLRCPADVLYRKLSNVRTAECAPTIMYAAFESLFRQTGDNRQGSHCKNQGKGAS
jgi:hypothetical protein